MNRSEIRKIGGSDVAAILGLSPWKSAHSLYLHLIGELPPQEDNEALARGREMEPVIAGLFAVNHCEFAVCQSGMSTRSDYPFLIGSPDRILFDDMPVSSDGFDEPPNYSNVPVSGLEIKTADITKMSQWGEEGTDEIPVEYLVQCQWYCGLLNVPDWYIAVGFVKPGSRKICGYREYKIEHDPARYAAMVKCAVDFWQHHVEKRIPPEITEPDTATVEYYRRRERKPESAVFCEPEMDEMIGELKEAQANIKKYEKEYELIKTKLLSEMGNAEVVIDPYSQKQMITFKAYETASVDYKELLAELGTADEVIEKYRRKNVLRRFCLK